MRLGRASLRVDIAAGGAREVRVFCPNCGTQNPDTAQTCSKCGFHLRSAAAPKFKGTMLMMNPPGVTPAPPGAAPVPRPPGAAPMPSKLKGTMVGVAPPQVASFAGPAPQPPGPPAAVWPGGGSGPAEAPGFSPPGVNPLGGTVAAEASAFGGPHGGGSSGAPAAPFAYGAPPVNAPAPHAYGAPPNAMAQPDPYGQQASPFAYGEPPAGNGGAGRQTPVQGTMAYGQPPPNAMSGGGPSSPPAMIAAPTRRDARMTFALPGAVFLGGLLLYFLLALLDSGVAGLGLLVALGGAAWYAALAIQMATELKGVTRNEAFVWWPLFVPFYSIYWACLLVPAEMARAKQLRGVHSPVRPLLYYVFLWHYALASDLNDLVQP